MINPLLISVKIVEIYMKLKSMIMKSKLIGKYLLLVFVLVASNTLAQTEIKKVIIDPVSGNKVDKSESFDWKYAGKTYYFSSYESRTSFKMNPQNYLLAKCTSDKKSVDLVCGMTVNMEESYQSKFKDKIYYFDSYVCKKNFKKNPEKYLKNICAPNDSIK